MVWLKVDQTSK